MRLALAGSWFNDYHHYYRTLFMYCHYLSIVACVITVGNNILPCVSAEMTILRKQLFNFATIPKYGMVSLSP